MWLAKYAVFVAVLSSAAGFGAGPVRAQSAGMSLGRGEGSFLHMRLQRTVLKVDVLDLSLCFDEATGRRFAATVGRGKLTAAAAEEITRTALSGPPADARIEFLRDIPLRDFLDGVEEDLRTAVRAGLLADSVYRALTSGLSVWYSPLEGRGIRKGDVLHYELRSDAVRSRFITVEGRTVLDRTETSRARRNSPLAAWLAPGSQFRSPLLQSLWRGAAGGESSGRDRHCRPAR